MIMTFPDENSIISDLREGNVTAFNRIFLAYHKRIYNFCRSLHQLPDDADETVQKVFIALWEQRIQVDENKSIASYLFTIARYMIYNDFKQRVYHKAVVDQITLRSADENQSTMDDILYNEMKSFLDSTIETLPNRQREIFKLNRFSGLTYLQIASKLGISENTVDTQMRRALEYLRKKIKAFYS
jgi:RNA polymerase sigma-70 factor, ECF subfamily